MRDKKEFQFLVKDTKTIADVYKMLNIGKEFYNFFQVCAQLKKEGFEINMKVPRFFSETRLPNYAAMVYEGFWQSLPAIIKRLEEIQAENWQGSAEQRKKADKAAGLQNSIYNLSFVLRLAGMVDIYKVFRWTVNGVQV